MRPSHWGHRSRQRGVVLLSATLSVAAIFLVSLGWPLLQAGDRAQRDIATLATVRHQARVVDVLAAYAQARLPPADGLALWLDGADAASMQAGTGCGGGAVAVDTALGSWCDKSGSDRHLDVNSGTPPPRRSSDGFGVRLSGGSLSTPTTTVAYRGATSFLVFRRDPSSSGAGTIFLHGSASAGQPMIAWTTGSATLRWWSTAAYAATGSSSGQPLTDGATGLASGRATDDGGEVWLGGGDRVAHAATWPGTVSVTSAMTVGPGAGTQDLVLEILVYDRALSNSERQRVETYLAYKWRNSGVALVDGHPQLTLRPLPCPASPDKAPAGWASAYDDNGLESRSADGTCTVGVGLLPWRTLGLNRRDAFDAFDRPYTYAVSAQAAGTPAMLREFCALDRDALLDPNRIRVSAAGLVGGENATESAQVPVLLILSHGPDGQGAHGPLRVRPALPTGDDATSPQVSNYDDQAYSDARRYSFAEPARRLERDANYFDDLLLRPTASALLARRGSGPVCPAS